MRKKELKIFGGFRTGSNLVRSLLELNYDVQVHNNNYGYKHIPVPADFRNDSYKPFPLGIISTVKDPFAFLDSVFRYCKKNNFLNIDAGHSFDEFCYQRFIVFDGGFKEFPRYWFANPIQYWNSIYNNLLSLPERQNVILRYEDLLGNVEGEIRKIGEKYALRSRSEKFIQPSGVTINLGDPERSSSSDYFSDIAFERREYYLERHYMDRFTDEQKDFIYSELDQDILQALSYTNNSSILETHTNKTSFVYDLRRLVVLGQERIPQLETSLAAEREANLGFLKQLDMSRSQVFELEAKILKDNRRLEEARLALDSRDAQLADRRRELENLANQLTDIQATLYTNQKELEISKANLERTQQELSISSQNASDLKNTVGLAHQRQKDLEKDLASLNIELKQTKDELNRAKTNYYEIRESFSFKLGYDLVHAIARPGKNTFAFPLRLFRNIRRLFSKDKPPWNQKQPNILVDQTAQLVDDTKIKPTKPLKSEAPKPLKEMQELNVACIFDEFTTEGYQGECKLLPVPLHGWVELFATTKPDLLFVESAWRGNGGQWEYKIGKYAGQDGSELRSLIKWCNEHKVPTVFWNKEDPVHYDKFIDSAKQFDVIFTTDEGQIANYRDAAGHDKVCSLQFSAQPRLHNPVKNAEVEDKVCFAGSYYRNIHDTRRNEMNEILDIAKTYGLVIYDRNYERNLNTETEFSFPERFRENIVGSLKYNEMDLAYKGYRYCLNVNSIKNSRTMFSRRVFESLACGTPVLSTWSQGVEETFGDLVLMTGKNIDKEKILEKLRVSDEEYRKIAVQGIRNVYEHHLYEHRFATILEKAGIRFEPNTDFSVTMVCIARNTTEAERLKYQFNNQSFKQKKLLLLLDFINDVEIILNDKSNVQDDITIFHLGSAQILGYSMGELIDSSHIAFISSDNYYGKWFLTDLVHAAIYTKAQVIGKATFFKLADGELKVIDGGEFKYTDAIYSTSSIIDTNLTRDLRLDDAMRYFCNEQCINSFFKDSVKCFGVNRFNYLESAYSSELEGQSDFIDQVDA